MNQLVRIFMAVVFMVTERPLEDSRTKKMQMLLLRTVTPKSVFHRILLDRFM